MPNNISTGIAYADPALVAGTTITGATITNPTITGGTYAGTVSATTINASTALGMTSGTVAAAGTDNTNAVAITTPGVLVTGANATKGAILPALAAGSVVFVKNDAAAAAILKVYPPSGAAINALTATTGAISLASSVSAIFWYYSATQVYTIPLLPS